jgi:hypothetical protein
VRFFQFAATCVAAGMLAGCAQNITKYDYTALREANPHSILVVPVVNKTTQVEAADTFLATLAPPLAERGYYVFPINMVKHSMEDDGLSDADMVANAPTARLAGLFGADAVLYAEVDHWEASYILVNTTTTVSVHYVLKSGKTGVTLWENTVTTTYSPQASSGNIIADLIADAIIAAMERAHPSYIPLARQANGIAFYDQNKGLLTGPYSANAK